MMLKTLTCLSLLPMGALGAKGDLFSEADVITKLDATALLAKIDANFPKETDKAQAAAAAPKCEAALAAATKLATDKKDDEQTNAKAFAAALKTRHEELKAVAAANPQQQQQPQPQQQGPGTVTAGSNIPDAKLAETFDKTKAQATVDAHFPKQDDPAGDEGKITKVKDMQKKLEDFIKKVEKDAGAMADAAKKKTLEDWVALLKERKTQIDALVPQGMSGMMIGCIVGGIFLVCLGIGYYLYSKKKADEKKKQEEEKALIEEDPADGMV